MTTESAAIAALTQQAGLLMDLPQALYDTAQGRIVAIGNEMVNRIASLQKTYIASLQKTYYVNYATGADLNDGSAAAPFKTIQKALDMTPLGGRCTAILQADYTFEAPLTVVQRSLLLQSSTSVRHALNFTRRLDNSTGGNLRVVDAFRMQFNATVSLIGLRLNVPALDGNWGNYADINTTAIFGANGAQVGGSQAVIMTQCDLSIPEPPYCALFPTNQIKSFAASAITTVNGRTTTNGAVLRGYPDTNGASPPAYFRTTLTAI
ncbi:hypothetical protein [Paracoccus sp. (in: a-proteobacteria)]|uniref:hypothetical protein n=1 Tax=Paracoccus sp. TaxID=267 RepID=UPI003A8934BD